MPIPVPLAVAGVTAAGSVINSALNAREARRNREFQERMSSTAHQREVRDLKLAGINPMIRQMGGASSPAGDRAEIDVGLGKSVSSALEARMMHAQLKLLQAQTEREQDSALLLRTQAGDLQQSWNAGKFEQLSTNLDISRLDLEQKRQLLPLVLQRARQEIDSMASSAEAARARAALDRAAEAGALNLEAFEKSIGEAGPWVKFIHNLLRSMRR